MAYNPKGGKKNFLIEFTNVTNEERNNIVRFIKDPSNPDLADTSNNFHCVVLSLFFRKDKHGEYIQNMRVRSKLWFFVKNVLILLIFFFYSFFKAYVQLIQKITTNDINRLFAFIPARKISQVMPVFRYNSKVTSESHDILANYVASSVSWHKCYGTLRPRGNTKKPKSPDDMFAKTGIPDAGDDGSGDSDSEFVGSCAGWTENDRTLRKHTPRAKKQGKHQRDETMDISPSKKTRNDPIDVDDFDFDDGEDNKELGEETYELKPVKPEIMTGMKPSNLKSDYKVAEKQEPEEPPKWFQAYAAVVGRLEKQLIVTMEKVEELKEVKNEKEQPKEDIQPEEKDEIDA